MAIASIPADDGKIIESISENLSFSQEKNNQIFSHQVDIQVNPNNNSEGLAKCKKIQEAILADLTFIEKLISFGNLKYDLSDRNVGQFPTIEYDSASCKYKYTSSWEKRANGPTSNPVIPDNLLGSITIKSEFKEDGTINITTSLEVTSNENPLNYNTAKTFVEGVLNNLYTISSSFYAKIKPQASTATLQDVALIKNYISSKNEGKYGITIVYTDDVNVDKPSETILEMSHSQSYEEAATVVSEEGTIYSLKPLLETSQEIDGTDDQRYKAALTRFNTEKTLIKERTKLFAKNPLLDNVDFKIIYYSQSHSYNEGIIKYTYRYSNNPALKYTDENDSSTILRKELEEKKFQPAVDRIKFASTFTEIGKDTYQILQESVSKNFENISSQRTYTVPGDKKFADCLVALPSITVGSDEYIDSIEITYSSQNRELTYSTSTMKISQKT
jgi:hypothetical protein